MKILLKTGYGSHTFKMASKDGQAVYCKFHAKVPIRFLNVIPLLFKTSQGIKNLPVERANQLASEDPVRIFKITVSFYLLLLNSAYFFNILGLRIARSLKQY